jgi:surfactin synthase thioesterase subunit
VQTLRAYRPKPYKGHVSLIYNENAYAVDPLGGWSNLISGDVHSYRAPGDHETYIREHVQSLAKLVRQCLEKRNGKHNEG